MSVSRSCWILQIARNGESVKTTLLMIAAACEYSNDFSGFRREFSQFSWNNEKNEHAIHYRKSCTRGDVRNLHNFCNNFLALKLVHFGKYTT